MIDRQHVIVGTVWIRLVRTIQICTLDFRSASSGGYAQPAAAAEYVQLPSVGCRDCTRITLVTRLTRTLMKIDED